MWVIALITGVVVALITAAKRTVVERWWGIFLGAVGGLLSYWVFISLLDFRFSVTTAGLAVESIAWGIFGSALLLALVLPLVPSRGVGPRETYAREYRDRPRRRSVEERRRVYREEDDDDDDTNLR